MDNGPTVRELTLALTALLVDYDDVRKAHDNFWVDHRCTAPDREAASATKARILLGHPPK